MTDRVDTKYKRVPIHRALGGWMPGTIRAKNMNKSIGNRRRTWNIRIKAFEV